MSGSVSVFERALKAVGDLILSSCHPPVLFVWEGLAKRYGSSSGS